MDEGDQVLGDAEAVGVVAAFHVAEAEALASVAGSAAQTYWQQRAAALSLRSPFLRDQRSRRAPTGAVPFPDNTSVDGPYGGRWPSGGYWR